MSGVQFSLRFEPPPQHDLFYFALRPDEPSARAAVKLAKRFRRHHGLQGRLYDAGRLHVSLCTAISRKGPRKGDVMMARHAAGRVQVAAFEVGFDRLCTFGSGGRRAIVLCCSLGSAQLAYLHERLTGELVKSGIGKGPNRDHSTFSPHLTLLRTRGSVPETRLNAPICWRVRDFVLVRSLVGRSRHIDLGKWPLS